jgi:hypothetical protein
MGIEKITRVEYSALQKAFDFFNARLFGGQLPQAYITTQKLRYVRGYCWPGKMMDRGDGKDYRAEIALNTDYFAGRTDEEICLREILVARGIKIEVPRMEPDLGLTNVQLRDLLAGVEADLVGVNA